MEGRVEVRAVSSARCKRALAVAYRCDFDHLPILAPQSPGNNERPNLFSAWVRSRLLLRSHTHTTSKTTRCMPSIYCLGPHTTHAALHAKTHSSTTYSSALHAGPKCMCIA